MYAIRNNYLLKFTKVFCSPNAATGKAAVWLIWILAILLLISAGTTYRVLASRLNLLVDVPIKLSVPLSDFPTIVGKWTGNDAPLHLNIQRAAGNDDFINRLYIDKQSNKWVNIYIAYTARPRTMLGHRPQVCYPAGGWVHDSTEGSEIVSNKGKHIPCLIHRFHMPGENYQEIVVLNYYIVNGQLTSDESVFSGVGWRTPNIEGDPARYTAQVQISSLLENSVLTAARDMTDLILDFFPDADGRVRAAEDINMTQPVSQ
jgi:hypothetical protein